MEVHERLSRLVLERGITQEALAAKLGKRHDWINARLIGRTKIKVDELPPIAKILGVDPCWLLLGDDAHSTAPSRPGERSPATPFNRDPSLPSYADELTRRRLDRLAAMDPDKLDVLLRFIEFQDRDTSDEGAPS